MEARSMIIEKIEGVEETYDVNLNKYELERIFLAIRTAVPHLTATAYFDSIMLSTLLTMHNQIMSLLKDMNGTVTVPVYDTTQPQQFPTDDFVRGLIESLGNNK